MDYVADGQINGLLCILSFQEEFGNRGSSQWQKDNDNVNRYCLIPASKMAAAGSFMVLENITPFILMLLGYDKMGKRIEIFHLVRYFPLKSPL